MTKTAAVVGIAMFLFCYSAAPQGLEETDRELEASLAQKPAEVEKGQGAESRLRFVSSALGGEAGLWRVMEAGSSEPWTIRLSLHGGFFTSSGRDGFLNYLGWEDYSQTNVHGALSISWTPLSFLEAFASFNSIANKNSITRPELLQSQGDFEFGLKGFYHFTPYLSAGADLAVTLANGIGGLSPNLEGTNLRTAALLSFDLRPLAPEVPLRAHLNAGFIMENTDNLEGSRQLNYVELFALNINSYHRVGLGLGLDAPLPYADPVAITPFLEYRVELPVGISDQDLASGSLNENTKYENVVPMVLTPGVRVTYLKDITWDIAVDVGIGGQKAYLKGVPSTPPWRLWFALTYAFDPARRTEEKIVEKVVEKVVEKPVPVAPQTGRIKGRVLDALEQKPVGGALLVFEGSDLPPVASDEAEGRYETYDLTPGLVRLTAKRDGYKPATQEAEIKAGQATALDFALEPEQKKGTLSGTVTDVKDSPLVAHIYLTGPVELQLETTPDGTFSGEVPEGSYYVRAEAEGYLAKARSLNVAARQTVMAEFKLAAVPKTRVVVLSKDKIELKRMIHFESGKAVIAADSFGILDEVVDVLAKNPQIRRLRIEGHTDSVGSAQMNMTLSQKRAEAVRDYLLAQGIAGERLTAEGFGPTRPIAPNNTRRGREQNRRVEFIIVE